MCGTQACIHAKLFGLSHIGLGDGCLLTIGDERGELIIGISQCQRDRMFRSEANIGHAVERIGPSRVHLDTIEPGHWLVQPERQLHTTAFTDPVALHGAHSLWPAIQCVQAFEQFFCIGSDANKPLWNFAPLHDGTGAPSASVDDLLVGQHGLIHRIPVHCGHFFVDEAAFVQLGEEPLFPLVVLWVAGRDFSVPVVGIAQPL